MSFSPPLLPKLLSLADFGGDLTGFIEHVEQYRQYTERMKKTKKNLLLQKSAHPSLLDAEVQENLYNEPVSTLIAEPSTMTPAIPLTLSASSIANNYLASLSTTIDPAKRQMPKSNKLFQKASNSSLGMFSNSKNTYDTSEKVVPKLTLPVHDKIILDNVPDIDYENKPIISNWKTLLKAQYGKVHKYACKACGKEDEYTSIKSHIETNHMNSCHFLCKLCDQILNSKQGLRQHNNIVHEEIKHKENRITKTNDLVEVSFVSDFNTLLSKVPASEPLPKEHVAPVVPKPISSFDPTKHPEQTDELEKEKGYQLIPKQQHSTIKQYPFHELSPVLVPSPGIDSVNLSSSPDFGFSVPKFPVAPVHLKPNYFLENKIVIDHGVIRIELLAVNTQNQEGLPKTLLDPKMVKVMGGTSDGLVKEENINHTEEISHTVGPNFNSEQGVIQQSSNNSTTMSLTCRICGRTMKNSSWLSAHMFAGHDKQNSDCNICVYTSEDRRKLNQHIKSAHFKTFIGDCSQCGILFTTKQNKLRHKENTCLSRKKWIEERVKEKQEYRERRIKEISLCKEKKEQIVIRRRELGPWRCVICHTIGRKNSKLHMKKHPDGVVKQVEEDQSWKCNFCEFSSDTRSNLRNHRNEEHVGEKAYSCELCRKSFIYSSTLMKHRKLKHDKNNRVSYHCTKQGCEKIFKTKDSHRRHMKTSSHLKPWKDLSRYQKAKRLKKEQAGQNYTLESSQNYIT